MRLVLLIPALGAGGAERVMSLMANHWAGRGWDIRLLTLDDGARPPFFPLHEEVRHRPLGLLRDSANPVQAVWNNARRLLGLRAAIRAERPEAVISFLDTTNVLCLLATLGLGLPVVVSEHTNPERYWLKPIWHRLRRWVYPLAHRVVVLTPRTLEFFPVSLRPKLRVVPNPVVPSAVGGRVDIPLPAGRLIVALGRLVESKGFDLLIEAFARLGPRYPDWSLLILGEGPARAGLEALRGRLGLDGRVGLPGWVSRPETVLGRADLFVLSSRFEGFPMALCEAMAAGVAVVAADCPTGPREIVRDGVDGLLVPAEDAAALAVAMERLMADGEERRRCAARAVEVVERFGMDRIMALWEAALEGCGGLPRTGL